MASTLAKCLVLLFCAAWCHSAFSQKKWTGSSPGGWENTLNWQPAGVPSGSDDVILDNGFEKNDYTITIPDIVVTVHSLTIAPYAGRHIELLLPVTNKNSPALIANSNGNSLVIRQGGVFRNSSGLTSGQSLLLNGSINIYDEGIYVHNSRSAHATDIVAKLSTAAGTAKGIFEFDVPGGSYPISLSNRTFGTLILSATASGGVQTYNASGANPVTINGDLRIYNGVQFNADLTKDMTVNGDFFQQGGVFNLASQSNNNTIKIKGDISQAAGSVITETSGGLPVLELTGEAGQLVSVSGSITNSVTLSVNNSAGIFLMHPMALPYKLVLAEGILKTSAINIISLMDSCTVNGGSYRSYVDGPVKKTGNKDFQFPVGKEGNYAPLAITRTPGVGVDEFIAEYFLGNPQTNTGSNFDNSMVRISKLEYWSLKRLSGSSSCRVTLSIGMYSNATALDKLVVARWDTVGAAWKNEGNEAFVGIATGIITSKALGEFGTFTPGSTVDAQNPLPAKTFVFNAVRDDDLVKLNWTMEDNTDVDHFEIEKSGDGKRYTMIVAVDRTAGVTHYRYSFRSLSEILYLRVKITGSNGESFYSDIVTAPAYVPAGKVIRISPVPVRDQATVTIIAKQGGLLQLVISDIYGRRMKFVSQTLLAGSNEIYLPVSRLRSGVYVIQMFNSGRPAGSVSFVKY